MGVILECSETLRISHRELPRLCTARVHPYDAQVFIPGCNALNHELRLLHPW